jgi:hypothetical protein
MKKKLNEGLPPLVPEYPVTVAGHNLTLRFDVNINKTKKGVKLQFVMKDVPQDPRQVQQMANEIGTELQERFGAAGLQVVYDVENPYKNVVGFLVPLPSLADYLIKHVMKTGASTEPEKELPAQEEPATGEPLPAKEEPLKENWLRKMAGLK